MTDPVRVEGLGALARSLKAVEGGLDDLKAANVAAAQVVLHEAQARAPRRTGRLAASGRVNKAARKADVKFGNARVPYAEVIHWGYPRRHIRAQPFVTTAAEQSRPRWLAAYEQELQRLLDQT